MSTIKELIKEERPIERFLRVGKNVSNEELLAILINQGMKNKSSKDLAINILNRINKIEDLKNITYEDELKKQEAECEVVEYVLSGDLKEMADKIIKGKIKYAYADGNYLNKDFRLKDNFAYTGDGIILNGIMYGKKDYKETDKTGMKDFLDLVFCMNEYKTEDEWKKANASKDEIVKFGCKMGNSIWHTINTDYIMDSNGSIERKCAKTEKYNKPILTNLQKADIDDIDR